MDSKWVEDCSWGILGFFTGGFAWIRMDLLGMTEIFQYAVMCFVSLSAAAMSIVGKEIGKTMILKYKSWKASRKPKK
jgi:hypothetical protein